MTLRSFKHFSAASVDQAAGICGKYGEKAVIIAGGTDLLGVLKDNIYPEYPNVLVDIKSIPHLDHVIEDERGLRIGALTTIREVETNVVIRQRYRLLAQAARSVASPQIRNMGTVGGNICQHPRCWYLRNPRNVFYCLRKGGRKCNALTGENQYHSVFGAARVTATACSSNCPGGVDVPSYVRMTKNGELFKAAEVLLDSNPIPAITGRVCPHFCEEMCGRADFDESVFIRGVERFIGDFALAHLADIFRAPMDDTRKTVAIVGSGPAGLSAAYYLRKAGHRVTVLDRMAEPGGMLTYCMPAYRLPKDTIRRQIAGLKNIGIEFRLNTSVGGEITFQSLKRDFDSIFLATGAWRQRTLGIEKEELLLPGLEFLTNVSPGTRKPPGKKVLVIGGGNVAVDVAITALRLGAKEVTMACLERREEMPAISEDVERAISEGIRLMPSWGPSKILETHGRITGMELVWCTSVFDDEGHFRPRFAQEVRKRVEADRVILAIGQTADLSYASPSLSIAGGLIVVDDRQATSIPGVFAGGDATTGTASVIEAVAAGRNAARFIDLYLTGVTSIKEGRSGDLEPLLRVDTACLQNMGRQVPPERPLSERNLDEEDIGTLDLDAVDLETRRCFNCACIAVNASDLAPALVALDAKVRTTKRTVDAESFFSAGSMKSTLVEADEVVTEIEIPDSRRWTKQSYSKFRIRNSIDFPVVSLASAFCMDGDMVSDAKIVPGAVAPIPMRMKEIEDFLRGKVPSEEVAEEAALLASRDNNALSKNKYKIQIVKALLKRTICSIRDDSDT